MRRKSERNKTVATSPEKSTRKLTRRGRRSSQTQVTNDDVEIEQSTEEQTEPHTSDRDSSSDREASKESATKPRRKISRTTRRNSSEPKEIKPTRSRRRTAATATAAAAIEENVVEEANENENENGEADNNEEKVASLITNTDDTNEAETETPVDVIKEKSPESVNNAKENISVEQVDGPAVSEETQILIADESSKQESENNENKKERKVSIEVDDVVMENDNKANPSEIEENKGESPEREKSPVTHKPVLEKDTNEPSSLEEKKSLENIQNATPEKENSSDQTTNQIPVQKTPENTKRSNYHSTASRKSNERRRRNRSTSSSSSSSSSAASSRSSSNENAKKRKNKSKKHQDDIEKQPSPSESPKTPPNRGKRHISPITSIDNNADNQNDDEQEEGEIPMDIDEATPDEKTKQRKKSLVSAPKEKSPAPPTSQQKQIPATLSPTKLVEKTVVEKSSSKKSDLPTPIVTEKKQEKPKRKRKWLSQKSTEPKPQIIAISTDSLKNLISDVKPVSLADVKLESSPEPEIIAIVHTDDKNGKLNDNNKERTRRRDRSTDNSVKKTIINDKQISVALEEKSNNNNLTANRKISLVNDSMPIKVRPPSPPKNNASSILYITNLVRPFTVLQLKGLLARTGKIVENGFWIDKIKSKCFVKYETEDEAVETRHALHGVRWPASNPKCLNVDFGTITAMGKAIASTSEEVQKEVVREERVSGGWNRFEAEERREPATNRPIREWDVGKKEELTRDRERINDGRDKEQRGGGGGERGIERGNINRGGKDTERVERRRRSLDRIRRSLSASPARKFNKKENDPPIRLLDDLFRKTKATPCIYWLPLTAEQIAIKEESRRKHIAEHKRRMEENQHKEKERERERERERDRDRDRNRDRSDRRSKPKDGGATGGGSGGGGGGGGSGGGRDGGRDNRDRDRRRY